MTEREGAPLSFCRISAPPPPPPPMPPHDSKMLNITILMTDMRDAIIFLRFWRSPMPPPPLTPQYLTILMAVRGGAINFCRILAPP